MPDLHPVLAMADCLVRHHERADGTDEGQRRERRNRPRQRNEGEQHDRAECPPPEQVAGHSEEEGHVPQEVQRCTAAKRDCGHGVERLPDIADRRLETEGEEHDAGGDRQVEIAVGV